MTGTLSLDGSERYAGAVRRVVSAAAGELGYVEKASPAQMDDKLANPGWNNYNKYARDLDHLGIVYHAAKNGYAWCDIFVDWCFIHTLGLNTGAGMLYQPYQGLGAGCTYSGLFFREHGAFSRTPRLGDQVFFSDSYSTTELDHTGIVVGVEDGRIYTIEGNTADPNFPGKNGGAVCKESYALSDPYVIGFGHPDWARAE